MLKCTLIIFALGFSFVVVFSLEFWKTLNPLLNAFCIFHNKTGEYNKCGIIKCWAAALKIVYQLRPRILNCLLGCVKKYFYI